jgi:hypothetical protein
MGRTSYNRWDDVSFLPHQHACSPHDIIDLFSPWYN